ncbi:MAG: 50S ribosomal protein L30, partial [Candidatus Hadarchaeota archaeon]|nr:50S ribosomal protein L30 [Candidatus Hadarchaeota archaeon]
VNVSRDVEETLWMLGLARVNHCVVVHDSSSYKGMLQKVKDFVTWGEIQPEALVALLRRRGRLSGDEEISDEFVKSHTQFGSIDEFAGAVCAGEADLGDLPGFKKVFRLHPPRKGYGGIKRPFRNGGSLGYRGEEMGDLILRMS